MTTTLTTENEVSTKAQVADYHAIQNTQTGVLNDCWLDTTTASGWWTPATYSTIYYGYSWPSYTKLRLTLSEVMKLRAAAKKDKALKAILQKFTPHIELVADFD